MKSLIEFSKVVAESKTCWDFAQNINFCATHISIYSLFSRFLSDRLTRPRFLLHFASLFWFNPLDPFLATSKIHSYLVFSRYEKPRESNIHIIYIFLEAMIIFFFSSIYLVTNSWLEFSLQQMNTNIIGPFKSFHFPAILLHLWLFQNWLDKYPMKVEF